MAETTHITKDAMRGALAEAVDIGRVAFRRKYGFELSRRYVALHEGHHIDSKALVAAAAARGHPPRVLTPANSSGGSSTTAVLERCEVKWLNTGDLSSEIVGLSPSDYEMDPTQRPSFWWANQTHNFPVAFEQGSLWASDHRRDGQPGHEDWTALKRMLPGDFVLHYAEQVLRGISRVITAATPAMRPEGYGDPTGYEHGNLVLVAPEVVDIEIELSNLQKVLPPGVGPMNRLGTPGRTYLSPLPFGLGSKVVSFLSGKTLSAPQDPTTSTVADAQRAFRQITTDVQAVVTRRAEQQFLRTSLLARGDGRCALCGRRLPEELLVAAHIKPRAQCTDEERLDFRAAAMLACTLGCDALFELGYIAVDPNGVIRSIDATEAEIGTHLADLDGRSCLAHTPATAPRYRAHWDSKFRGASRQYQVGTDK